MAKKSLFGRAMERLWPKKFTRRYRRYSCNRDGVLIAGNRLARIPGRLLDLSQGGALFRPPLHYLLDRDNEEARLEIDGVTIFCQIVRTIPLGYSLQFNEEQSEADVHMICRYNPDEDTEESTADHTATAAQPAGA